NTGTSGAVISGLRYALEREYDWVWVFDADSAPRADALAELLDLFESLPQSLQERTRVVASLPIDTATRERHHGINFTTRGVRGLRGFVEVQPEPEAPYYECDSTIWSGSMFRLDAVRSIGLPLDHYLLDWGDHAYGYSAKLAGYRTFISQRSIIEHNLHTLAIR